MLEPAGPGLWYADGGTVSFHGFDYPTRMVVIRLADGGLWLWSPVEMTPALESAVRALGRVRHIVSPNRLHYLFLEEWHRTFPDAKLWGTGQTIARCRSLHFAGTLTDIAPPGWRGEIDQFCFDNSPIMDEVIFFHRASRTAIIADLSQTFSRAFLERHWPWWIRPFAKLSGMTEGKGHPPLDYRLSFRHRKDARPKIRALIAEGARQVIPAHGTIVREGGEQFLRQAFSWLL